MDNSQDTINLLQLLRRIKERKRLFIKTLTVALVLSCVWILPKPRYYSTTITLAPETENMNSGGTFSSIASNFGINLDNMTSADAIYPLLYPDVISSANFIVDLFDTKVASEDGKIKTDYYTYLAKHQKVSIWEMPVIWLKNFVESLLPTPSDIGMGDSGEDRDSKLLVLTKKQDDVVNLVRQCISCSVDKKTDVVTITVEDQDRLICATMADSVRLKLQAYITDYRTQKARIDVQYYTQLADEARRNYDKARRAYASFADANTNLSLTAYKAQEEDLQNEMQLMYSTYSNITTQLQLAKAKVQERTPAFTILQWATVPQKPAGPKRMLFVAAMLVLTFIGTSVYVFKGFIMKQLSALK